MVHVNVIFKKFGTESGERATPLNPALRKYPRGRPQRPSVQFRRPAVKPVAGGGSCLQSVKIHSTCDVQSSEVCLYFKKASHPKYRYVAGMCFTVWNSVWSAVQISSPEA